MMGGMADKGGNPVTGTKADAMGMPAGMARHHQMMEGRMDMMQTMMEMMLQRMPPAEGAGK